jgi:hypothetical protein
VLEEFELQEDRRWRQPDIAAIDGKKGSAPDEGTDQLFRLRYPCAGYHIASVAHDNPCLSKLDIN